MTDSKDKLQLKISIGSSHTALEVANVNDPAHPTHIANDYFEGDVVVRVKGFTGYVPSQKTSGVEDSEYFSATSDTSSVQFRGTIKADVNGNDLLFGNDFDNPIKDSLPHGTALGLKALKWIDPSLESDLYSEKPWAFSPLIATMNLLNTTQQPAAAETKLTRIEEDTSNLVGEKINVKQRRAHFADAEKRKGKDLKGLYVCGDFSNPFIDFNNLSISLPYVSLHVNILQYWKGQPFRYTCKTRSGEILFCVVFELVDGEGSGVTEGDISEHKWK